MHIRKIEFTDVDHLLYLYNLSIKNNELLYKPLTKDQFMLKFMTSTKSYEIKTFISLSNQEQVGLISGVVVAKKNKAYITFVFVDPNHRRKSIGTKLLNRFENYVKINHPSVKEIDIVFFNPIQFEWYIPKTNHHDHPNAPGVDQSSGAATFFSKLGYQPFAKQNSYYRYIRNYELSSDMHKIIDTLKNQEITITFYDRKKHHGFEALFTNLNNPYWQNEITKAISTHQPILIAEKNGLVIGFTGPLSVQKSLRGYFAGIGVHDGYRGYGIGKVLFACLCLELKKLGAHYMSLFTGENNPARKIYEKEDFKIVRSWLNMRKDIK